MKQRAPLIIEHAMRHWPAMSGPRAWSDLEYLSRVAGMRTVPVEIGANYLDRNWKQQLMPLGEFIKHHVLRESDSSSRGYLAQTQLFDQVPRLRDDIAVPDYCYCKDDEDEPDRLIINAWFGPNGTVSPCHHDPYHNLLSQVVGFKFVRLFAPQHSEHLYPHNEKMHSNTSRVDVMNPDLAAFPLFVDTPFLDCVLAPGEMLYIPPRWWHYVQSLSVSFSVSFWWS
jgi:hypothetical protein